MTATSIVPVVFTVTGLKVTEQAAKLPAVKVTDELLELEETSFPITIMKGLVVTAG